MTYESKDYSSLLGLPGFSNQMLENHFKLYQGYVTNTNKVADRLTQLAQEGATTSSEYMELKRRFGWEFNGMRLHEYYFENMSATGGNCEQFPQLMEQMDKDFGATPESWKKDFTGVSAIRGIGWAIMYYDPMAKRLFNVWVNEHDVGHLAGGIPLLVFDVFEHAYMLDYGINRADYIAAFFNVINWQLVNGRFEAVVA